MSNPYGSSKYKITKREWKKLNKQYKKTPEPVDYTIWASGEHYELARVLRQLGFSVPGDKMEMYRMAGEILSMGWEK